MRLHNVVPQASPARVFPSWHGVKYPRPRTGAGSCLAEIRVKAAFCCSALVSSLSTLHSPSSHFATPAQYSLTMSCQQTQSQSDDEPDQIDLRLRKRACLSSLATPSSIGQAPLSPSTEQDREVLFAHGDQDRNPTLQVSSLLVSSSYSSAHVHTGNNPFSSPPILLSPYSQGYLASKSTSPITSRESHRPYPLILSKCLRKSLAYITLGRKAASCTEERDPRRL